MAVIDASAEEYLGETLHTANTLEKAGVKGEQRRKVDVVIVGAGPGGLTTATMLAEGGLKVLVVEGGSYWPKGRFERKQSWALKNIYQDRGQRVMMGNAFISLQSGRGVGGGTLVNSAISFRAPDSLLDSWEEEFGVDIWHEREIVERKTMTRGFRADPPRQPFHRIDCRVGGKQRSQLQEADDRRSHEPVPDLARDDEGLDDKGVGKLFTHAADQSIRSTIFPKTSRVSMRASALSIDLKSTSVSMTG